MAELLFERSETGVATLALNRPQRKNAVRPTGWEGLRRLFHEVAHDASTRVVVITGAGGDFCAGADLATMTPDEHPLPAMGPVNAAALAMQLSKKLLPNAFAVGLPEALDTEAMAQTVNILSDDMKEGVAAFLQKRAPVFRGR